MRKKILFILDEFYPIKNAPAVRINSFIDELKSEYQIDVLGGFKQKVQKKVSLHQIKRPSEKNFIAFAVFLLKLNWKSISLARKKNYDSIILSIPKYELLFCFPFLKKYTSTLILDIRDSFKFLDYKSYFDYFFPHSLARILGNLVKKIIQRAQNKSIKKADLITVANQGILDLIIDFKNKTQIVSNGVDVDLFFPKEKKPLIPPINLVYVGNFAEKDNFQWIVKVLPHFGDKVVLNLIGTGRKKSKVIQELKKAQIKFNDFGHVKHIDLPAILQKMHLGFIFREKDVKESIPVAIYEFSSMNIPTLSNSVGIMARFIINKKLGLIISNEEELATTINKFIQEPQLFKKYRSLHPLAKKEFSRKKQAEIFKKILFKKLN